MGIKFDELRKVVLFTSPLVVGFLTQKAMQFIDTYMLGWLGPGALAAAVIATNIFIMILVFSMGALSVVGVFIVQANAANKPKDVVINLQNGVFLALLLSLPSMALVWFVPYALVKLAIAPDVLQNIKLLLHALMWGLPGYLLFLVFREYISAFFKTRIILLISAVSLILAAVGNYVLIYGKYGFPALGIAGVGYAGSCVMWFMFLALFVFSLSSVELKKHLALTTMKFSFSRLKSMLAVGASSGMLFMLEGGMFLLAALLMSNFGVNALAAHQIVIQCMNIAYAIPSGLSMAAALLIGHSVGENDYSKMKRMASICYGLGIAVSLIVSAIFVFAPHALVSIFLKPNCVGYHEIVMYSISFFAIAAVFQTADMLQTITNGVLRGFKDTQIPLFISLACYWLLGIPCAYYLSSYTSLGAKGIWYALGISLASASVILLIRLFNKMHLFSMNEAIKSNPN